MALGRVDAARADSCTHEVSIEHQYSENNSELPRKIGCFRSGSSDEKSDFHVTEFDPDPDYWRQGDGECTLAADLNGKLDSKSEWKVLPSDPRAQHMQELKDCLSKASFESGGFLGIGAKKVPCWDSEAPGFFPNKVCMEQLCKCNKQLLKNGDSLQCKWSASPVDCNAVQKALEKGGVALIDVLSKDANVAHTLQVRRVWCDDGKLAKVLFRDPEKPQRETVADVCGPPCNKWRSFGGTYNGMKALSYYIIEPGNNK